MSDATGLFQQAINHHQAGNLQQAEELYRQVLQIEPRHADANHLWGVIAFQAGRPDLAIASITQAIALNPSAAVFHGNLGLAQEALGQFEAGLASFRRALLLDPDFADAHNHLASALHRFGDLDEAVKHARRAVELRPDFPEAHNNLARALYSQGATDEAEMHLRRAIELRPNFAQAHNNLAVLLADKNRSNEAENHYREALRLDPNYREALNNLGNILGHQGKFDQAIDCYRRALRIDPNFGEAQSNLGAALLRNGRLDEAVEACRAGVALQPQTAEAHNNLGGALLEQGNLAEATKCFRHAHELQPGFLGAYSNLLFCLSYDPQADPDEVFAEHRLWGATFAPPNTTSRPTDAVAANGQRRLRIGYVSADFRQHPLVRYLEPVLAHHDKEQVEVFCYAEAPHPDDVTFRLQKLAHHWRSVRGLSSAQAAKLITDDGIDILVDLAGHTSGNRLDIFALKPAPIQVTWLGYLNTTGMSSMDYRLTDNVLDPLGQPERDSEQLFRLPDGFCCFEPWPDAPNVTPLPASEIGHLTFGSLHNLFKLNSSVYDLWSQVLRSIPNARLLMYRDSLQGAALNRVRHEWELRGISGHRLDLVTGRQQFPGSHLHVYKDIDISLDAFPWSGGVTTCESLWMGVPMLSLMGERPASRNSASFLKRVGLSDWACATPDAFIAKATHAAGHLSELASLRSELRGRMQSTICDVAHFTKSLEAAYKSMWHKYWAINDTAARKEEKSKR